MRQRTRQPGVVFAALPELSAWGPTGALALAEIAVEPSGGDETYWITDEPRSADAIEEAAQSHQCAPAVATRSTRSRGSTR